jgi:hypothetical protein
LDLNKTYVTKKYGTTNIKGNILLCFSKNQIYLLSSTDAMFMAAARELARYKLDLVGVQEVRWDKGSTIRVGDDKFFYGKVN